MIVFGCLHYFILPHIYINLNRAPKCVFYHILLVLTHIQSQTHTESNFLSLLSGKTKQKGVKLICKPGAIMYSQLIACNLVVKRTLNGYNINIQYNDIDVLGALRRKLPCFVS